MFIKTQLSVFPRRFRHRDPRYDDGKPCTNPRRILRLYLQIMCIRVVFGEIFDSFPLRLPRANRTLQNENRPTTEKPHRRHTICNSQENIPQLIPNPIDEENVRENT